MNKDFVRQYASLEENHWWFLGRQKILLHLLKKIVKPGPLHILNIGAAGGATSRWLADLGKVVSTETDPFFIDHLQSKNIPVTNCEINSMPFDDNVFDLVCAFDVIEHVENDSAALEEMQRVCKPEGTLCVAVPAQPWLWSDHDVVNGHFRRYTKHSLAALGNLLTSSQPDTIRYFNSLLFVPIFFARKFSTFFSKKNKTPSSDFSSYKTPEFLNRIFRSIFSWEASLLNTIHFPVGVSLFAAWKKNTEGRGAGGIR